MKAMVTAFLILSIFTVSFSTDRMIKVVFRQIFPEVQDGSFSSLPKTIYICGKNKGRMEELPDSSIKLHQLFVYNNGDTWMVNIFDNTGKYIKDPGPTFNFYAPIFPEDSLMHFSYGLEEEFLAGRKVKQYQSKEEKDILVRETSILDNIIIIYTNKNTGKPLKVELYNNKRKLQTAFQYIEYLTDLPSVDSLFAKPTGIQFNDEVEKDGLSEDMLSYYIDNFYKNPHDTILLARLVNDITQSSLLQKENSYVPIVGFFCGAFGNNPGVDWKSKIESSDLNGRKILLEALDCAVSGDTAFIGDLSPELNDFYWSKYFATGDSSNIVHIIENLRFYNERRNPYLFLTSGTAKWSLASNAKQHEKVRIFIEGYIKNQKGIIHKELKALLRKSPETIHREMLNIMKENKANWKKNGQY